MNIQGLVSNIKDLPQVRQVQPGKLEEIKKAAADNQLDEAIIENEQGSFVVYGRDLHLDYEYADNEGRMHRTLPTGYIGSPKVGEKIILGDLKGKLVFFDDQTDRLTRANQVGLGIGGVGGFVLGAASASKASDSIMGAVLGSALGSVVGMGLSYGLTRLLASPDFSANSIERFCLPNESNKP